MSDCSLAQGTVQNPIKNILVRGRLDKPITYIHDQTVHFSGMIQSTKTSLKRSRVKLNQTNTHA
jgi:hypothetical protein